MKRRKGFEEKERKQTRKKNPKYIYKKMRKMDLSRRERKQEIPKIN